MHVLNRGYIVNLVYQMLWVHVGRGRGGWNHKWRHEKIQSEMLFVKNCIFFSSNSDHLLGLEG